MREGLALGDLHANDPSISSAQPCNYFIYTEMQVLKLTYLNVFSGILG